MDLALFQNYYQNYVWEDKHALLGYPPDTQSLSGSEIPNDGFCIFDSIEHPLRYSSLLR